MNREILFRGKAEPVTSPEEAWDIGEAWEHFCREKAELWAELWLDQALAEKERADKAEALVRELVGVIDELCRQINECGFDGEMWDVYQRAKEVLGDE